MIGIFMAQSCSQKNGERMTMVMETADIHQGFGFLCATLRLPDFVANSHTSLAMAYEQAS